MKAKNIPLKTQKQLIDLPLAIVVVVLIVFGLLMVYDASIFQALKDQQESSFYIRQQLLWTVFGVTSALFFSKLDYHRFKSLSTPFLFISFILLLAVFIPGLGVSGGGAHRWLKLGFLTVQPAEIIKLSGVIFLASVFEKRTRLFPLLILVCLVSLITAVLQRDLGSTIVFVAIAVSVYFAAGGPLMHFIGAIPLGIIGLIVLVLTSEYRSKRILAFLDPFSDPQGYTYHIKQVLIALGSGGLFGLGLGHSRQKFEYIPEVSTDSIFAIIGEELGFLGGMVIIALFIILVSRGFRIAQNAPDNFGKILAVGLTSWLGIQAIINLSSMVSLLPLTGVPLPFISYGGSALVVNLTAVGILLNISKQT